MTDSSLPPVKEFNFFDFACDYAHRHNCVVVVSDVGDKTKVWDNFCAVYPDQTHSEPMPREEAIRLAQMQQIALGQPDDG